MQTVSASFAALIILAVGRTGAAQQPPEPPAAPKTTAEPASTSAPSAEVVPAKAQERTVSLEPTLAERAPAGRAQFHVDPIADTGLIGLSFGFGVVLELINSTGEIRPQQISPNFDRSQLIGIDRASITASPSKSAGTLSNLGLGAAIAFGFIDPVLSGVRESSVQTGLVDGMLYAESMSMTFAFTDMVKLAVRRPRPGAYIDAEANAQPGVPFDNPNTDSALSFFSGHASMTATVGATATYLAFTRSPKTARPWITLGIGTAVTTFVSIERVRAGKHFPTDVIAGAVAGAGIGIIVPHLHREEEVQQRRVWIGYAPIDSPVFGRSRIVSLSGTF